MAAKCLMLDVDGVLVDGRPQDGQHWKTDLLPDLGLSPDALRDHFFKPAWKDIVVGKAELLPTLEKALARIGTPVTAKDVVSYWFRNDSRVMQPVLADVRIARSKGVPVYLTTNQEHTRATYLMQTMGLQNDVDGIIYSAQLGWKKPEPEFFALAQEAVGRGASDLLLIDDTLSNVKAAQQTGWAAHHWDGTEALSAVLERFGYSDTGLT